MKRLGLYVGSLLIVSSMVTAQAVRTTLPLGSLLPECNVGRLGWIYQIADATDYDDCTTFGATGNSRKLSVCVCRWTAGSSNFEWEAFAQGSGAGAGTIGGSTGSADDVVLCSDGTGGATVQACNTLSVLEGQLTVNVDNATDGGELLVQRKDITSSALRLQARQSGTSLATVGSVSGRLQLQAAAGNDWVYLNSSGMELRTAALNKTVWLGALQTGVLNVQGSADGSTGGGVRWVPRASPPVTCGDSDTLGVEYVDTSLARCFCDGTSWQVLNPLTIGVGACS